MATLIIVVITSLISIIAFKRHELFSKFEFNAYQIYHRKEWYRLITHGFLHADWMHLIVNMLVLLSFGTVIENYFGELEAQGILHFPVLWYLLLYVGGLVVSSLISLKKHKDDIWYNSLGASGAVSSVIFCSIFFAPWQKLYFYAILPIPGIIFGILYLWYSSYASKKNRDNINHEAHFVGALFGFIFPLLIDVRLINIFIHHLLEF